MSDNLKTLSDSIVSMNDMYEEFPVDSVDVLADDLREINEEIDLI